MNLNLIFGIMYGLLMCSTYIMQFMYFYKLTSSITRVLLTYSLTDNVTNSSFGHILFLLNDFDVFYGFATYNLIRKLFLIVKELLVELLWSR